MMRHVPWIAPTLILCIVIILGLAVGPAPLGTLDPALVGALIPASLLAYALMLLALGAQTMVGHTSPVVERLAGLAWPASVAGMGIAMLGIGMVGHWAIGLSLPLPLR